jgi:hypothetical protein
MKGRTTFAGIAMAGWRHLEEVDHSSGTGRGRERGSAERRHRRTRAGEESVARPREVHSRSRSGCKVGHGGEGVESGPHRKESGAGGWRKGSHTEGSGGRLLRESQWPGGGIIWRRWTTAAGRDAGGGRGSAERSQKNQGGGRERRARSGDSRIRGDEGGDPREVHSRSRSRCEVGHGGGVESGPHRKEGRAGRTAEGQPY